MIYFCADDYGLCTLASENILECVENGGLNKVSVLPNFDCTDINELLTNNEVELSLHLNLVEGKALSSPEKINLLVDETGRFKYSFAGLWMLSLFKRKEFEKQVYIELKAQVEYWNALVSMDIPILIDSHQHTHMIPVIFKTLVRVLTDLNVCVKYLRIPSEPVLPYIKEPSLYLTYSPVNIIKQWLLRFFWMIDKREYRKVNIPTAYFFGILFSGSMDEKRVRKILPHYIKLANKSNMDIEVLFHPGHISGEEISLDMCNKSFEKFYYSDGRKTEFDAIMNLNIKDVKERSV